MFQNNIRTTTGAYRLAVSASIAVFAIGLSAAILLGFAFILNTTVCKIQPLVYFFPYADIPGYITAGATLSLLVALWTALYSLMAVPHCLSKVPSRLLYCLLILVAINGFMPLRLLHNDNSLEGELISVFEKYRFENLSRKVVDGLQSGISCCGIRGVFDWRSNVTKCPLLSIAIDEIPATCRKDYPTFCRSHPETLNITRLSREHCLDKEEQKRLMFVKGCLYEVENSRFDGILVIMLYSIILTCGMICVMKFEDKLRKKLRKQTMISNITLTNYNFTFRNGLENSGFEDGGSVNDEGKAKETDSGV